MAPRKTRLNHHEEDAGRRLAKIEGTCDELKTNVTQIKTAIIGIEGTDDRGLFGMMTSMVEQYSSHVKEFNALRTRFWWLVGILVGSGLLSVATYAGVELV